jgi:hypothetical protein
MRESDFLALKRELWNIIRTEKILVTNQNLDFLLERAYTEVVAKIIYDEFINRPTKAKMQGEEICAQTKRA